MSQPVAFPPLPPAQENPEVHADWLELCALRLPAGSVSIREFIRDLGISDTTDAITEEEDEAGHQTDADRCESIAESAFGELDDRHRDCGHQGAAYPFQVMPQVLERTDGTEGTVYRFLALLSCFGRSAGPPGTDGARLFEDICVKAAKAYFGGDLNEAEAFAFGFPRRVLPPSFKKAVDDLCRRMGEGVCHRRNRTELPSRKDAKLDIVAWRDFHDRRRGKLIGFGQCATGQNWKEKLTELPATNDWCTYWLDDRPAVWPIRLFFVPHRVAEKNWLHTCVYGGILFDRCRIAGLTVDITDELVKSCREWSEFVLTQLN